MLTRTATKSTDLSILPWSFRARLRMTHVFNRVGNAPRFVFQISNLKSQIEQARPAGHAGKRNTVQLLNVVGTLRVPSLVAVAGAAAGGFGAAGASGVASTAGNASRIGAGTLSGSTVASFTSAGSEKS